MAETGRTAAWSRIPVLLVIFLLLTTLIAPPTVEPLGPRSDAWLRAEPVPLDASRPGRDRIGRLLFRRGWSLSSTQRGFGGISAMHVSSGQVVALNDAAIAFRWALPERAGRARLEMRPLPTAGKAKRSRDSEAMVILGDRAWIAFERTNLVARFHLPDWRLETSARPAAMAEWSGNQGAEAMVRLEDGRFLVFGEGPRDRDSATPLLLFESDPSQPGARASRRRFKPPRDYRVTDAAWIPGGGLLVLVRRFTLWDGVAAKLVLISAARLDRPIVEGEQIADFRPPFSIDNMEALSIARENGRTIVRIASDDNFVDFQRTLLLEFELLDPPAGHAKRNPRRLAPAGIDGKS